MASMLLKVLPRIYDSAHAEAVAIRDSKISSTTEAVKECSEKGV